MKKIVVLLLAFVTIALAESADRTGPYIAVGGGYAVFNDDNRMGPEPIEPSYNLNLIGGAFINKYLSVELSFDYFDTFRSEFHDNTTDIYIFEAVTKVHYPFWKERIDLYAAFGAGGIAWKETLGGVSQEDNSGALSGDVGIGFRTLDWLTLNMGYRRYYFTLDQVDNSGVVTQQYNMELSSAYVNIEVQF
ncbi:MAG: porin family protein [Sulfurimonadaceae bacterium]